MSKFKEAIKIFGVVAIQYVCSICAFTVCIGLYQGHLPESNVFIRYSEIIIALVMGSGLLLYSSHQFYINRNMFWKKYNRSE